MVVRDEAIEILDRIAQDVYTGRDIDRLRQLITVRGNRNVVQVGRYNVRLNEGRNIHIGDRVYRGVQAEMLREVLEDVVPRAVVPGAPSHGSLRGVSGFIMTVGTLIALGGLAYFGFGIISAVESIDSSAGIPEIPDSVPIGFAIAFGGGLVYSLGLLFRGWERPRRGR